MRRAFPIVVVLIALSPAACGGGDGGDSSGDALTKATARAMATRHTTERDLLKATREYIRAARKWESVLGPDETRRILMYGKAIVVLTCDPCEREFDAALR